MTLIERGSRKTKCTYGSVRDPGENNQSEVSRAWKRGFRQNSTNLPVSGSCFSSRTDFERTDRGKH